MLLRSASRYGLDVSRSEEGSCVTCSRLFFVGTAGSGKSALTGAFGQWVTNEGYDCITVNLDPGADSLPYEVDVDIRDWVRLSEVMKEYGLGPNGAQVLASDMLALNIAEVVDVIDGFDTDYALIDTPGQLELFAFRKSSQVVVEALSPESSAAAFLFDPVLSKDPNGFVTSMLLSTTVRLRLQLSFIPVLSKSDLLSEAEQDMIGSWSSDFQSLWAALCDSPTSAQTQVSLEFLQAIDALGAGMPLSFVSSDTWEGMTDIYAAVQMALQGGEDVDR
ncbi:MAG: ATP/GTP-binding protein [Methanobacteriota archaeon]|nr:MAG: ATP/GTP-binding protein [Euryarchaeota archaeon]